MCRALCVYTENSVRRKGVPKQPAGKCPGIRRRGVCMTRMLQRSREEKLTMHLMTQYATAALSQAGPQESAGTSVPGMCHIPAFMQHRFSKFVYTQQPVNRFTMRNKGYHPTLAASSATSRLDQIWTVNLTLNRQRQAGLVQVSTAWSVSSGRTSRHCKQQEHKAPPGVFATLWTISSDRPGK